MKRSLSAAKRVLTALLCLALCLCTVTTVAHANSWGLTGSLLSAVMADKRWHDYSTVSLQAGDAAVMGSRYHRALMVLENGELQICTTAVYQPDDGKSNPSLKQSGGSLVLSYGSDEVYTFEKDAGTYVLSSARMGDFTMTSVLEDGIRRYLAQDEAGEALYVYDIPLSRFNIKLFPHSTAQVRHLAWMNAALRSATDVLGLTPEEKGMRYSSRAKKTVPVYSAPFGASAWRASKGKAAVALADELWVMRYVANTDGECYACVRYDVSERTQRIGYIKASALDSSVQGWPISDWACVPVSVTRDTFITDDPDVSQYAHWTVPEGTLLTCMGLYGQNYAYVSGEVSDKGFADGGQIIWGFVPVRDLTILRDDTDDDSTCRTAAEALTGAWYFTGGGSMAGDVLVFAADGTYQELIEYGDDTPRIVHHGQWQVSAYNSAWNLYWNDPAFELTLIQDNGRANVKGLSIDGDGSGFSLTNWEGGGSYTRITPEVMEEYPSLTRLVTLEEDGSVLLLPTSDEGANG